MTTHGRPEKLTTTNRCTSRPSTARFFARVSSNGAEEPNVAEVASRAFRQDNNCFSGKMRETRCDSKSPFAALCQYLSTRPFTAAFFYGMKIAQEVPATN
ncbi:hypothetical protein FIBSPDRAFT_853747 [Athelia psychrophila]|uniref:Uncharacterized protein n=1 Tax=Athelia psychrophila TaxID=1759441 RepID=A0A166QGN1_9AGAM|nr:hypothetical protein FIBSPDRAFT_871490 [Fibularhizoctonia sp. CBS 109695]KZP27127.1 hypothetical protein FIBSPDRAFT_853747 [Fibularhizoctonia sp. CBS 109695]